MAAEEEATSASQPSLLEHYLSGTGGRWGGAETRLLNDSLATALEDADYTVTGGAGRAPEEWFAGPGGGTKGGTFVDITGTNGTSTIRIQTISTMGDGVTPTWVETAAANRIRVKFPNDTLILVPK
jgi:filamentous hemagglutinin